MLCSLTLYEFYHIYFFKRLFFWHFLSSILSISSFSIAVPIVHINLFIMDFFFVKKKTTQKHYKVSRLFFCLLFCWMFIRRCAIALSTKSISCSTHTHVRMGIIMLAQRETIKFNVYTIYWNCVWPKRKRDREEKREEANLLFSWFFDLGFRIDDAICSFVLAQSHMHVLKIMMALENRANSIPRRTRAMSEFLRTFGFKIAKQSNSANSSKIDEEKRSRNHHYCVAYEDLEQSIISSCFPSVIW